MIKKKLINTIALFFLLLIPLAILVIFKNYSIPHITHTKKNNLEKLDYTRKIGLMNLDSLISIITKIQSIKHNFQIEVDSSNNQYVLFKVAKRDSIIMIQTFFDGVNFSDKILDTLRINRYSDKDDIGFNLYRDNLKRRFVKGPYIIPLSLWSASN